jgi:uncharacterized protein involved in exopolysaccharide biosynthesis
VLKEAAERTGMDISASTLRRETTVETPSSTVKTTTSVVNIVVISVTDTDPDRAAAAANALAEVLLERLESGVDEKIALLEEQLTANQEAYAASLARSVQAENALAEIADGDGSAAEKAMAGSTWVALAQAAATQQESLSKSIQQTQLLLLSAQKNEQPRMLHEAAVPDSPSGPDMTVNVAIGALAGLVIGIVVAFARRGLADRRAAKAAAA